ncbi:glycosyltransferase family 1 protein [Seonamhaeicola sp. S2-3]|uniref:glycosyltransferase family 4 protein n=1 Tax=Seonamhaeicola sp. S2-3 TaxID=1936081 RepID=UPI0009728097|nr:glycosyltransferase family 4 protein [Seonamhaeicola sp. S2-3]APY12412.1 glycosyltransferase family 1 protein [Seonamhaeicola sp. S2-3]
MKKLIRITTIPGSINGLLRGQLKFMSAHYEVIGISSNDEGFLKEVSERENFRPIAVEMTRKISPLIDIIGVIKLYTIIKKEKPFIVHTHTPKAGTLGMIAAKLAGVPHRLHTIAGLPLMEATGIKRKILNKVEKLTYACATKIYPNSYGLKTIILNNKFTTEDKLKVIGNGSSNGINTEHFNPKKYDDEFCIKLRKEWNINKNDFVFVFIGRLVADKGINELIAAFNKLCKNNTNIKLLLVGKQEEHLDPLKPETLSSIKTNKQIVFAGWQNDVRPYFAISNALVFPSYREGFPNVVLQAGAMELASIVTDINGCNEIVSHNENGIIVPVKSTEKLYEAMQGFLLKTKEELRAMGKKSRDRIVKMYDQQFVWDTLLKEYKNLKH